MAGNGEDWYENKNGRKGNFIEDEKTKKWEGSKCWFNTTNEGKNVIIVITAFNNGLLSICSMSGIVEVENKT